VPGAGRQGARLLVTSRATPAGASPGRRTCPPARRPPARSWP
jgi:hypothetical protein